MKSTIKKYLNHSTTIKKQTFSRGTVTETEETVMGYVTEQVVATKNETGTHLESKTVVMYEPDVEIEEGDRVEIDNKSFKVNYIRKPRFYQSSNPNHLEVVLD